MLLRQEDLEKMSPSDALGRMAAYELYELDGVATLTPTSSKNLALKVEHKNKKKKVVKEESSEDEDGEANLSSMIKTTMRLMKNLNKKGLEFNPKTGRFSPKGEHSSRKVKCYNCRKEGHIA